MSSVHILSFPALAFVLCHYFYFLSCFISQFKSILRQGEVVLALIGSLGMLLFYFTCFGRWDIFEPYQGLLQGGLWGLASFSFFAFFLISVQSKNGKDSPRQNQKKTSAIKKLPILGLLLGVTFMNSPLLVEMTGGDPLSGIGKLRIFMLISYFPSFLFFFSVKEIFRPAWRSFMFFGISLVLIQFLGILGDEKNLAGGPIWGLLENISWVILNFFLFQSVNFLLVKQYLRKNLS